jgi:phosphonate transport system substrate-binding protein
VVATDSTFKTLKDLKGKRFALGCCHSTTGNLVPRFMLQEQGVALEDLATVTNLKNHDTVARAVIRGEYDAGAVKDVIARHYAGHGLRILAQSQDIPSVPLVARKGTSPELISAVVKSLLALDRKNPGHRSIMDKIEEEFRFGFVRVAPHDYRDLARLFTSVPLGCSTGCHQ